MTRSLDLTALVGSRICHDLISPLGAIGNGVELLAMAGAAEGPEMELISESVNNANARLRFFRIAYGVARPDQVVARNEVTSTLAAAARGGRLAYEWKVPGDQNRREVQLAFLLLQCFESAMPYGGDVTVARSEAGRWDLIAEGQRLKIDAPLWESINAPHARAEIGASEVQFALLHELAGYYDRAIALKLEPTRLTAHF